MQKRIALRVISAYRTVSYDAAIILARMPPYHLMAAMKCRMYQKIISSKLNNNWNRDTEKHIFTEENARLRAEWKLFSERIQASGKFTRDIILPMWDKWLDRRHGSVNFRITQALSGHGVFNYFLHKINKAENNICQHCEGQNIDTDQHTLQECTAWMAEREEIMRQVRIGNAEELTLTNLVGKMLDSKEEWQAANQYINKIIAKKEEKEKMRQQADRRNVRNAGHNH
ncbi:Reverse transcriptase [Camponotus japonicus]